MAIQQAVSPEMTILQAYTAGAPVSVSRCLSFKVPNDANQPFRTESSCWNTDSDHKNFN